MIKHIVMWKLKESAEGNDKEENAKIIKAKIEKLKDQIDIIVDIELGINLVEDPSAYDIVLYSVFKDKDDLDKYATNPMHLEIVDFVKKVVDSRIVVDYEISYLQNYS